jgi:hypothetical protein
MISTDTKPLLGPNQKLLVDALRSGKFTQTTAGVLHDVQTDSMCCLGVAAKLFLTDEEVEEVNLGDSSSTYYAYGGEVRSAPEYVVSNLSLFCSLGSNCDRGDTLADLNDEGSTFVEIADLLEADPSRYFSSPT